VYNVGTGVQTSLLDLVQTLADGLRARGMGGEHLVPLTAPARSGDLNHSVADVTAIAADLGWHAKVTLAEGLSDLVDAQVLEGPN
jgi:nucleoside-diphosphate-sugar epimerase